MEIEKLKGDELFLRTQIGQGKIGKEEFSKLPESINDINRINDINDINDNKKEQLNNNYTTLIQNENHIKQPISKGKEQKTANNYINYINYTPKPPEKKLTHQSQRDDDKKVDKFLEDLK